LLVPGKDIQDEKYFKHSK